MLSSEKIDAPEENYPDNWLKDILQHVKRIAIIGASDNPLRPSYAVAHFLAARGYEILSVNPQLAGKKIAGAALFASLRELPTSVDIVDIFRRSDAVAAIIDEALQLQPLPQVIWMQLGVRDVEAAAKARARRVKVVMNRCPKIEYQRLL